MEGEKNDHEPQEKRFSISRRNLLMIGLGLGLGLGLGGMATSLFVLNRDGSVPPALPEGYAYLCYQDSYLMLDGAYLIMELS